MKICIEVNMCQECPYRRWSLIRPHDICDAVHPSRQLTYKDIYEEMPDWCPFKKKVKE